ncbi:TonB-dependent receptor [Roseateles paludis]
MTMRPTAFAALAALATLCNPAAAQEKLDRVEVTGTAIKRLASETALPVQVISRQDIVKAGVTTAAELMANISAASNSLTDGVSMMNAGYKDQAGFNSANLRGLGTSSTLVLLNGRRMANFASPGDDSGVDLNSIPLAAVQRVEVLLDGASALYGSDAIGGVINFITRKDYRGLDLDISAMRTQEGGAGKRTASVGGGFGDLARDRFNVMAVVDVQRTDALNTAQRKFIDELKVPERLPHLLSSAGFPANIRLTRSQRNFLEDADFKVAGHTISSRTINLAAPTCSPPHTLYLPDGIGGVDGCTFDYMRDVELYPDSRKSSFLGRAVFQLSAGHQMFIEQSLTDSRTRYTGTSNRIDADIPVSFVPSIAATGLDEDLTVRTRLIDAGPRKSQVLSKGARTLIGLQGSLADWDYDAAINHSTDRIRERDVAGYYLYDKMMDAFYSGLINPFGPQKAAGLDYLRNNQLDVETRTARGVMDVVDLRAQRSLGQLAGGELGLALGAEWRQEKVESAASALLLSDNILGDTTPGDAQSTNHRRKVWALYGEVNAPLSKQLELQFAVRHDRYQDVGSSTNPKLGVRFQPTKALLLRASAGTGFRAPSLNDLYRPVKTGETQVLPDPVCMRENDNDLATCADFWTTRTYANAKLKPERSRQFSIGMVLEPLPGWSASVDYWSILKRDVISTIGDDIILRNEAKYASLVHRLNMNEGLQGCDYDPEDSTICFIELRKDNRGRHNVNGLDLSLELKSLRTSIGAFGAKLIGTLALKSERQTGFGDDFVSNLGKFVNDGVVQRWRHRLTFDWSQGPWNATLSNTYLSSYTDQNSAIDNNAGTVVAPNRVKAYSLWDLSAAWEANKQFTVRAGIKNLANTAPPFSNQAYFFLSGYDPSYTDPRGRSVYASIRYSLH